MKAPIILATDTSDLTIAKDWAKLVAPHITGIKLGLEFFLNFGAEGVRAVCADHEQRPGHTERHGSYLRYRAPCEYRH